MYLPNQEVPLSPAEQFHMGLLRSKQLPEAGLEDQVETVGFWPTVGGSLYLNSVITQGLLDWVPYQFGKAFAPPQPITGFSFAAGRPVGGKELHWNFYEDKAYNNEQFLAEHPYLLEDYDSGALVNFHSEAAFDWWLVRKRQDWSVRQNVASGGFLAQLAGAGLGNAVDMGALSAVVRASPVAQKLYGNLRETVVSGTKLAINQKTALAAGLLNLFQEEALDAINRDRNIDRGTADLWAFGAGYVLTSMGGLLATGGAGAKAYVISSPKLRSIQKVIAEGVSDAKVKTIVDLAKADYDANLPLLHTDPGDARINITAIRSSETAELLDALTEKYGDRLILHRHPLQTEFDLYKRFERLDSSTAKLQPADLGPAGRIVELQTRPFPAGRLRRSPSYFARLMNRTFFSNDWPTAEARTHPVVAEEMPPAEAIQWGYHQAAAVALRSIDDAFVAHRRSGAGPMEYIFSDGRRVTIRSRWDLPKFREAVTDHWRQLAEAEPGVTPAAPEAIHKAAQAAIGYWRFMGEEARQTGWLRFWEYRHGPSRSWLPQKVRQAGLHLRELLLADWRKNRLRDFNTRKAIDPDTRPLIPRVVEYLSQEDRNAIDQIAETFKKPVAELTEKELRLAKMVGGEVLGPGKPAVAGRIEYISTPLLERYLAEVEVYLPKRSDAVVRVLSGVQEQSALEVELGRQAVFSERGLVDEYGITEGLYQDYLDNDIASILSTYDRKTSGRLAFRKAIQYDGDHWEAAVKELTGKSLADSDYDAELVLQAMKQDFQDWQTALEKFGRSDLGKEVERSLADCDNIFRNKLQNMRVLPMEGESGPYGVGFFLARQLARLNSMSMLGFAAMGNMPDLATLAFNRALSRGHIKGLGRMFNFLSEFPTKDLEGIYVAFADSIHGVRSKLLFDWQDIADRPGFGPGRRGLAMEAIDRGMDALQSKFFKWSALDRWNTNTKRFFSGVIQTRIINLAPKMARAYDLIAKGMPELDAMRQVGLGLDDARWMARLGFGGKRSSELLDVLFEHGCDVKGAQPWKGNRAAFDALEGHVFPRMGLWETSNRQLYDAFNGAVSGEVMSLILEPKALSRPLSRNIIARFFHQFQGFSYAWSNQLAVSVLQRPVGEVAGYAVLSLGLGALVDAVRAHLYGRRTFAETARLWENETPAMVYVALMNSGLLGWLGRYVGMTEQVLPVAGPREWLTRVEGAGMYRAPNVIGLAGGPWLTYIQNFTDLVYNTWKKSGRMDARDWHRLRMLMPFQGLWEFAAVHRVTEAMGLDNPFGPGHGIDPFITRPAYEAVRQERRPRP